MIRAALFCLLVWVPACLELASQRVVFHHDLEADRLTWLIFYDGLYSTRAQGSSPDDQRRLRESAERGDVMLLDWPFVIKGARKDDWENRFVTVELLGHHRDPMGRLGVVQRVTIKPVSEFLKRANRAIDAEVLADKGSAPPGAQLTAARIRATAERGDHAWLSLEGHALWIDVPAHPREWRAARAIGVFEAVKELLRDRHRQAGPSRLMRFLISAQSVPLSVVESSAGVRFRLGMPDAPVPWRLRVNDGYNPGLEPTIKEVAPRPLDLAKLPDWAPMEVRAKALVDRLDGGDTKAGAALEALAKGWNTRDAYPPAPKRPETGKADDKGWIGAWRAWSLQLFNWPMPTGFPAAK